MLLPVTPGDRAGEAAVRGRGVDTTQPRFHAGLGMEYPIQHDSLGIPVFKEQRQNKSQLSNDDKCAEL